ncbi:hypothetical protein BJX96DRAFT_179667 [Aspergillus floccosus]
MSETFPSAIPREQGAEIRFAGPGKSATAPEKPKPHASKILNKLDPRFDQDILEEHHKETHMTESLANTSNR